MNTDGNTAALNDNLKREGEEEASMLALYQATEDIIADDQELDEIIGDGQLDEDTGCFLFNLLQAHNVADFDAVHHIVNEHCAKLYKIIHDKHAQNHINAQTEE